MPNVSNAQLQGFERSEQITIEARRWQGLRRQLIRLVLGFRYADKETARILEACKHDEGCPAVSDRAVPCLPTCPDREIFLSALVIKHNAELYSLLQRGLPLRPDGEYRPPSRETYDAVVSEFEMLREAGDLIGMVEELISWGRLPSPWADPFTVQAGSADQPKSALVPAGQEDPPEEEPSEEEDDGDDDVDDGDTERPPPGASEEDNPS